MASPGGPVPPQGQPTPQQIQAMREQLAAEAAKKGMTVEQYVNEIKAQAMRQQQQAQQQGGAGAPPQQQGQQVPINPGAPNPKAIAVANWLRTQNLKSRTCILNGQRKDMFKVKRAIRALSSPEYAKASSKKPDSLPPVTDRASAENVFKLLPLSLLALRVSKADPHEGHNHGPTPKKKGRVKGLWTVKVEQQQDAADEMHFVWLYEGSQWKQKLYAGGALMLIMAVVLFPLWPYSLRVGVWYLSMGMVGLIGLFFAMAIFRLILFVVTMFLTPPGLWLYPNLFEDVGFFDSFRPLWGWQEDKKTKKKSSRKVKTASGTEQVIPDSKAAPVASTTSAETQANAIHKRDLTPRVEEVADD